MPGSLFGEAQEGQESKISGFSALQKLEFAEVLRTGGDNDDDDGVLGEGEGTFLLLILKALKNKRKIRI